MKNAGKILALLLAMMMVMSLFAGCGAKTETATTDETAQGDAAGEEAKPAADAKVKIGLSLPTQREERWVKDKETMEAAATEAGVDLAIQIADNDAAKQQSQAENLLAQGIEVLILAPHDGKAAANIVTKAHDAGIKVLSYDRLVLDSDVDYYLSFDNEKVGEIQGEWFVSKVDKGNIIVLAGDPGDNNATLFKKGAMSKIQPKVDSGDYKVVMDQACKDWKAEEALKLTENALTKINNDIAGVLAPNDGTAGGVIQALAAQKLDGKIPVTGMDAELAAAKRIAAGTQGMTIFKDTRELGKAAIKAAISVAKGETIETNGKVVNNGKIDVPSILLTPVAVDKDNIQKVLVDSGYLKAEDLK